MNAHLRKKTVGLLAVAAPALLAACAGPAALRTDQASPLAPRIQTLVDENRRYPRWEDFPAAPEALPPVEQVAADVGALARSNAALTQEVAGIGWTLNDADRFAEETRRQVDSVPVSPDAVRTREEIDALAQTLRERAKAPPPIDRRP